MNVLYRNWTFTIDNIIKMRMKNDEMFSMNHTSLNLTQVHMYSYVYDQPFKLFVNCFENF